MTGVLVGKQAGVRSAEDAFCDLVGPELQAGYHLAGYLLGNGADGQDAVQEAVERAWASFGSLRDPERFGAWFRRIVVNACRDRLRRRRLVTLVELGPEHERIQERDAFRETLMRDSIGRALDALSPDERVVVVLHYWNDLGTAEIAALLGIPRGTVKFRLHTAYRALRRRLECDEAVTR